MRSLCPHKKSKWNAVNPAYYTHRHTQIGETYDSKSQKQLEIYDSENCCRHEYYHGHFNRRSCWL